MPGGGTEHVRGDALLVFAVAAGKRKKTTKNRNYVDFGSTCSLGYIGLVVMGGVGVWSPGRMLCVFRFN